MPMTSRTAWALCAAAGAAVIGITLLMGSIEGAQACDDVRSPGAMIRFEWVRTPAEVQALFGEEPCRSQLAAAMDGMNRIDGAAFIPAFTLFQLFAAWALRGHGRRLAAAVALAAVVAALCDWGEDSLLFAITAALPGEQAQIDQLFWLVRAKFALLALAAGGLGLLLTRTCGASRWLGFAMIAGGAVALAGLADPRLLGAGIGLAWTALLAAAVLHTLRGTRSAAATG
jgi:hypothetical protein